MNKGYDARRGVRPLRRVIQDELEHPIAEKLLGNDVEKGHIITIGQQKGELVLTTTTESDTVREH